ncbi:uncharacterized protein LOC126766684 [Bactrocera neohumeralis]|uniref:uncharacterized protein LOC126766684 n=1 Tax=Bactrocera neohumeralis TaxID=98809 RepID=UPI0021666E93|nr:uncharacterized protein LOC126766684 [Bactrocera neohumeralis]
MLQQAETLYAQENPKSRVKSLKDALALTQEVERAATLGTQGTRAPLLQRRREHVGADCLREVHDAAGGGGGTDSLTLVLDAKPSSAVTTAVASINWTALRRDKDFVDASKKLRSAQNAKAASRLTSKQNLTVRYNTALLHLNSGNLRSCKKLVEAMAKEETKGKKTPGANAAVSSTETLVQDFIAKRSSERSKLSPLIAVQVYLEAGDLAKALEALNSSALVDVANTPSGVATRAAWLCQLGRLSDAAALIEAAVQKLPAAGQKALLSWAVHYFATQEGPVGNAQSVALLKAVCAAVPALAADQEISAMLGLGLAMRGDAASLAEARQCLSKVTGSSSSPSSSNNNRDTSASLSTKEIDALGKKLPSRAAVEERGFHRHVAVTDDDSAAATAATTTERQQQQQSWLKKRRARPMRHPPKVAPEKGKLPDPERWVPMSMRSYIKDLPDRKKKELKRLRAQEQEQKRRAAEKRKAEAAAAAAAETEASA